jgi:hypothetical protein
MSSPRVEFDEVRMLFANSEEYEQRTQRIAQLTMRLLRELLRRDVQSLGANVDIDRLEVGAVNVSFATMSDETIARRSAAEIHRALLNALGK